MKKLVLLFALSLCVSPVIADNLFQNTNPFPQTSPERMNNLYEAEPSVIQDEEAKKPKEEKPCWFKRNKTQSQNTYNKELPKYPVNEGAQQDGSFYVFK